MADDLQVKWDKDFLYGKVEESLSDVMSGMVFMLNSKNTSTIEVLRTGTVHDRGFKVTEEMLEDYVKNFKAGVYGTRVQVNLSHNREGEAAGWITQLIKEGDRLFAQVEWTPLGLQKIQSKQYQFTSAELALSYPHWQTGDKVKNVLIGVALTNVPAVKGLQPVSLSEEVKIFLNNQSVMDKLKGMYDKLAAKGSLTETEMKEFAEACSAAGDVPADEKDKMMKGLSGKVAKDAPAKKPAKLQEEKPADTVSMSEFKAEQEKNQKLAEQLDRMQLSETFTSNLAFAEGKKTGFVSKAKDDVIDFMLGLTAEQRTKFADLVTNQIQVVDLSVHGATGKAKDKEVTPEKVVELAEKKMAEAKANGKELDMRDAQKAAMTELSQ